MLRPKSEVGVAQMLTRSGLAELGGTSAVGPAQGQSPPHQNSAGGNDARRNQTFGRPGFWAAPLWNSGPLSRPPSLSFCRDPLQPPRTYPTHGGAGQKQKNGVAPESSHSAFGSPESSGSPKLRVSVERDCAESRGPWRARGGSGNGTRLGSGMWCGQAHLGVGFRRRPCATTPVVTSGACADDPARELDSVAHVRVSSCARVCIAPLRCTARRRSEIASFCPLSFQRPRPSCPASELT